jgi:hypothetical protein
LRQTWPLAPVAVLALFAPPALGASILDQPGVFSCDGGLPFPQSALRAPGGAERGDDGPARALRRFIRTHGGRRAGLPVVPRRGWRVLARSDDVVVFQAGGPDGEGNFGTYVEVEHYSRGWRSGPFGGCGAYRVVEGHEVAELLPPGRSRLRRGARSIRVPILTGSCGGGDPSDRFERFELRETRRTVTVLALMRPDPPPPPGFACPAIGYVVQRTVRLEHRLGRRALRDGGRFPPLFLGRAR